MAAEPAYRPVNDKTVAAMPAQAQADIQKARTITLLDRATQHQPQNATRPGNDPNHALLQKANHQSHAQPALSPTDQYHGQTAVQARLEGATMARHGVTHSTPTHDHSPAPSHTPNMPGRGHDISR